MLQSKSKMADNSEGMPLKAGSQGCEFLDLPMRMQQDFRVGEPRCRLRESGLINQESNDPEPDVNSR